MIFISGFSKCPGYLPLSEIAALLGHFLFSLVCIHFLSMARLIWRMALFTVPAAVRLPDKENNCYPIRKWDEKHLAETVAPIYNRFS